MDLPSSDKGLARLAFAVDHAAQTGEVNAWLIAAGALYDRSKARGGGEAEMRAARAAILERVDPLRAYFRSRVGRLWAAQQVQQRLGELFHDEIAGSDPAPSRVFEILEAGKSRTLLDHLGSTYVDLPDVDVRARIRAIEKSILSFPKAPSACGLIAREMRLLSLLPIEEFVSLSLVQQSLRSVEAAYAAVPAGFSAVQPTSTLSEIQQTLQPDELLIDYLLPPRSNHPASDLHACAVTSASMLHSSRDLGRELADRAVFAGSVSPNGGAPVDVSALGTLLGDCRVFIENGDDKQAAAPLARLFGLLIQPILDAGIDIAQYRRWIVSPHRLLHAVPWSALMASAGRSELQRVALTLAPSASVWHRLRRAARTPVKTFLAFGNPKPLPDRTLAALPKAEEEVNLLASMLHAKLDCTPLVTEDATESALRAGIDQAGIVHLATHGAFPEEDAIDFHQLLLAAGGGFDGCVRAEELRAMPLQSVALAVFSICDGGLYRFGPGDEPYGLVPAVMAAGALNVVGPLWKIADDKARQFMTTFYSYLLEHGPPEALRLTCRELAEQGWAIRDWAAFILLGTGSALPGWPKINAAERTPCQD